VVSKAAAVAMARGAGRLLEADIAVAVTGVGGPDPRTATSRHGMDCYLA
jgi:nicotinamide-nucleotide amidase